jgi:hypothetical protein
METELENERRRKNVSFFDGGRLMFSHMDKFQCWATSKDEAWSKLIRLAGLTTFKLTPMKHLVIKDFSQLIVRLNVDAIKSMVQGVKVIFTKNHVTKNQNHQATSDVLWKGVEFVPIDGTLKRICPKRRVET